MKITNCYRKIKVGVLNMKYLLQVDFTMEGPFGEEMSEAFTDLAKVLTKSRV